MGREITKIVDTQMFGTPAEVMTYVNTDEGKENHKYDIRKIDDTLYKVEKSLIIKSNHA